MLEQAILIGFAAWRLAAMLSYERGPFKLFVRFRELLGFEHDDQGKPTAWPEWEGAELVACMWCLGVWMAVAMYGVWQLSPAAVMVVAAMALVIAVERWVRPS